MIGGGVKEQLGSTFGRSQRVRGDPYAGIRPITSPALTRRTDAFPTLSKHTPKHPPQGVIGSWGRRGYFVRKVIDPKSST